MTYQDEFMTPAAVAQQSGRTNRTPEYNFGASMRRLEEKLDRALQLLEQLMEQKATAPVTGEYPAVKLFANMMDGKVYWSVKGGPYMKHGASIWPEVLGPSGFGHLQPTDVIDLAGWTAVYTANADGSNPKVIQLVPPSTSSGQAQKTSTGQATKAAPARQPDPNAGIQPPPTGGRLE